MTQVIRTYNLFLNTAKATLYATPGETNDITWSLHKPFVLSNASNKFRVRVDSCQIPMSFYQLRPNNGNLSFTYISGSTYNSSISFSNQNPNINVLLAQVTSLIQAQVTSLGGSVVISSSYSGSSGKVTLSVNTGTLTLNYNSSIICSMLGFSNNIIVTSSGVTSTRNVNVNPSFCLYIRSTTLIQSVNWESIEENDVVSDIICAIPLNTINNTYLMYDGQESPVTITNDVIDSINLYISDNLMTKYLISLGGLDWGVHIVIEEITRMRYPYPNGIDESGTQKNNQEDSGISELEKQKSDLLSELLSLKGSLESDPDFSEPMGMNTSDFSIAPNLFPEPTEELLPFSTF